MSDPDQARHVADVATGAAGMGVIAVIIAAFTKLWTAVFGTKAERIAAERDEGSANERAAELALKLAQRSEEDTKRHRIDGYRIAAERDAAYNERDSYKESLRKMNLRILDLEAIAIVHAGCGPRIAELEAEKALARRMLADYTGSAQQ